MRLVSEITSATYSKSITKCDRRIAAPNARAIKKARSRTPRGENPITPVALPPLPAAVLFLGGAL